MANLFAYDPTRGGTVPIDQARVIAYVIDQDTGKRYSNRAEAEADIYTTRNPKTKLSPAQLEAQALQAEARTIASSTAKQLGLKVDPKTGMINEPAENAVFNQKTGKFEVPKPASGFVPTSGGGSNVASKPQTYTASDGRIFTNLDEYNAYVAQLDANKKRQAGQSAYDLLFSEFDRYGLGALVNPLKDFITEGLSPAEFTLRLRNTDAYKKRFAGNQIRVQKGLRAISEAEYIGLEDAYQETMRQYGLPESYYARGDMGRQEGFEKLIGGGVAPTELEYRIQTAYDKVINAAPEVSKALREFYPDISNGDILAFVLDPENARDVIKRKVTAAEIGGAAMAEGLATGLSRAEELARFGVTGAGYREAAPTIKQAAERGSQLTGFYNQGVFDQATAEQAVLGISGSADAQKKIKKLAQLEQASFSGTSGAAGGALGRERAGQF